MTCQFLFDIGNGLSRIQVLGTNLGAIHNGVTAVQLQGIIELLHTLGGGTVAGILHPTVGLHQHGGAQVGIGVPPVRGTGRGAASAQDAFVHAIQLGAIFAGLQKLGLTLFLGSRRLQPRFNALVLFVKVGHVRNQVFENVHVRKGVNLGCLCLGINVGQASQGVATVNVHGARATNTFAARSTKGQGGILFALDFNESVQHHGTARVQVDGISAQIGSLHGILRIPAVHLEILDFLRACGWCGLFQGG
mmetsp:Transcript_5219/g.14639  ORF Transcript_5219/g.14639 Transcript_5219/m.14639 type:complete len:249 (+) Transcript_5219:1756-2502(+)